MASLSHTLSTFRQHLEHLSHRLTILNEAEGEQLEAQQRQLQLQTKYLDALSRQTAAMNELATGVHTEVIEMLAVRGDYDAEESDDSDVESFLGRKIVFEEDAEALGRDIKVMDVDMRHSSVREELKVLGAQMSLETLDRAKLFRGFIKMSRDLKDEIDDVIDERDTLVKAARRSGGRQERKDMTDLEEKLTLVRCQYIEKNKRISDAYLAMNEKDIFKR